MDIKKSWSANGAILLDKLEINFWRNCHGLQLGGECLFSFQTFKDKRYWTLLIPFVIILIGVSACASNYFEETPLMAPIFLLLYAMLFWGIYHLWKYIGDKKQGDI